MELYKMTTTGKLPQLFLKSGETLKHRWKSGNNHFIV